VSPEFGSYTQIDGKTTVCLHVILYLVFSYLLL